VSVGGKSKQQLLAQLADAGVELNEAARILFSSDKFTTLNACQALITVELTVRHLGFTHGATILELYGKAVALGLRLAPIELGPHLRLQYLDQPEGCWGYPVTEHRAPPGSILVAPRHCQRTTSFQKVFICAASRALFGCVAIGPARLMCWIPKTTLFSASLSPKSEA
jgi:hypothetical protein